MSNMYVFPNGMNIQFLAMSPETARTNDVNIETTPPEMKKQEILQALKEMAPNMNRKDRRANLARIRIKAKTQVSELAKKEIAKQRK